MNKTEYYSEIMRVIKELQDINEKKLLLIKKYSNSRQLFYYAVESFNISEHLPDTLKLDIGNLQRIITEKNEAINQFIRVMGGIE